MFERIDLAEEAKLVRKLDTIIMPLMALVYFFQYIDKGSINYAAVFGLRTDLNLSGLEYSWVVSLFYFGQLASEYPAAYILSRFRLIPFVGTAIVIWGIAATRVFLGFAEACVSPAFIIITSNWYKRNEHPLRVAAWVSMNGISQIIGALLMYAVGHANLTIASWRAIFLIFGGLTTACGLAFLALMPRDTTTAWFLSKRERHIATQRLAIDRLTRDRAEFNRQQLREALVSPLTWLDFFMALCITLTTPILKFSSIVINGFGYSNYESMLVGLPGGAINFITVWISALIPRIFPGTRICTAIGLSLVPLCGSIILLVLPIRDGSWGIVAATWLAACCSALISATGSLMASNVKGNTKKSVVSAGFFIVYCVGCIVSPQAWTEDEYPRYAKGCILSIVSWTALIAAYIVYLFIVRRVNSQRDAFASQGIVEYMTSEQASVGGTIGLCVDSDLTDVMDKGFRYST
ncbi:MFS general substrate transporter [Aspergillus uvarum CBS 121591]|uniref:MFS general substrate transporter n=1 Tax=Aspergillus uvarum CBS 121591 TaxID=1448315 RepID=A0A319BRZ8_9EURO|nr:MFS general substrate transporter [Aspergillus uvarum CBS 121591]PYH76336.1 MFS general substrate transporter [Aspergillus uvarum CBS 121591]